MDFITNYITKDIKLSTYNGRYFKTEVIFEYHILVWLISGETKMIQPDSSLLFKAGDIFLIPRNQLATVINYPQNGQPHQSVAMHLTKERLQEFYTPHAAARHHQPKRNIHRFKNHPLLASCLASLIPYFELEQLPADIASIKIKEAITILRATDKSVDGLLADFSEPGKIDLLNFMERNFMFNMPIENFSYLTGRSEATFRRDFKKLYKSTPQKWLTEKRLHLAHYLIAEKNIKPIDAYAEAGFENLSHFSHAFKNCFGYSPNRLVDK